MTDSAYFLRVGGVWLELPELQAEMEISVSRPSSATESVGGVVRTQVASRSSRVWPFRFTQDSASVVRYLTLAAQGLVGDVFLYDAAAAQVNMLDPRDCIGRDALQPTIPVDLIPLRTFAAGYTLAMKLRAGVQYHLSGTTTHTAGATIATYNLGAGVVNIVAPAGTGSCRWSTSFTGVEARTCAWTGTVNASTSTASSPGPIVLRTNIGTNPRAIAGNGGWINNSGATWTTAFVTSGFPVHPLGITTAVRGNVQSTATSVYAMSVNRPDNIAAAGSPARRIGLWVCSVQPGYQVDAIGGYTPTPLTAGVWTFVETTTTVPAGGFSRIVVGKTTGNAVSTDMVYTTGCVTEAGDTVGSYFDGSTPSTDGTVTVIPTVAGVTSALRLTEGSVDQLGFVPGMKAVCQVSVSDPQQTLNMVFADRLPLSDYSVVLREVG